MTDRPLPPPEAQAPDRHPDEDELLALALGHLDAPEETRLLGHAGHCARCRTTLEELAAAVDLVLPAAPTTEPPPGLDETVLRRMGLGASGAVRAWRARRRWLPPVAAGVAGLLAGAGLALGLTEGPDGGEPPAAGPGSTQAPAGPGEVPGYPGGPPGEDGGDGVAPGPVTLATGDGVRVGQVHPSALQDQPVLVVEVTDAPAGRRYTCVVRLPDGERVEAGRWTVPASGEALWLVPAPEEGAAAVELVGESGGTWATAELSGR